VPHHLKSEVTVEQFATTGLEEKYPLSKNSDI
jgi:hypothetical protein